jgi:hypothetical protein
MSIRSRLAFSVAAVGYYRGNELIEAIHNRRRVLECVRRLAQIAGRVHLE